MPAHGRIFICVGTLNDVQIQEYILGKMLCGLQATLGGYDLTSWNIGYSKYPIIVPKENAAVTGCSMKLKKKT